MCDRCGALYAIDDSDFADPVNRERMEVNPCLVCSRGKGGREYRGKIELECSQ